LQTRRTFIKAGVAAATGLLWGLGRTAQASRGRQPLPSVDLQFLEGQLAVVRRADWTSRPADGFNRITVHHAGNAPCYVRSRGEVARDLEGVLTAHRERHYGDIGYHFVVDYVGCVWEGRSLAYEGAHVLAENEHNIGIMALGNFEKQRPSAEQIASVITLVDLLRHRFRVRHHRLYGHCDLGQSVCPGRNLYPHVVRLRA